MRSIRVILSGLILSALLTSPSYANASAPPAPTITSISVSGTQLTVNFTAPSFGGTITGYQIEYSTTGSTWTLASSSISSAATSYAITGLNQNTAYYVRIAAKYSGGLGAWGYKWEKLYATTSLVRDGSGNIIYSTGYGLGAGDAAAQNSSTPFTRVRYEMRATYGGSEKYVFADFFKSFSRVTSGSSTFSINNLRIPSITGAANQFEIHAEVEDLTILSNVADVQNGYGYEGRLEIWPWNYATAPTTPFTERSAGTYDDSDSYTRSSGSYGSFQLHRISSTASEKKTIFAWNNHYSVGEVGFGNFGGTHSDWTFAAAAGATLYPNRSNFKLEIFINPPVTTGAASALANASLTSAAATSASSSAITVNWNSVANASSYTIRVYNSSNVLQSTITNVTGNSRTITGLSSSTTYKFSIQAIGNNTSYLSSSESSLVTATTHSPVTVTINRSLVNPYSSRNLRYTFTFSENITGFTTSNLSVSGTSTGWTLGSLSGSGSSYSITLTNSSPIDGTINLTLDNSGIAAVSSSVQPATTSASTFTLGKATQVTTWIKFLWGEDLQRF